MFSVDNDIIFNTYFDIICSVYNVLSEYIRVIIIYHMETPDALGHPRKKFPVLQLI